MNRREFLSCIGLSTLAVFLDFNLTGSMGHFSETVEAQGTLYRGAPGGQILTSKDAGQSWKLHTNFGPQLAIKWMSKDWGGRVIAHREFQGWPIEVGLAKNGMCWKTL